MVGPAIAGLRGSFLDPTYFCENHVPVCTRQTFTRHLAQDYVADLMASKPVSLQSNSYLNDLYESISGDSSRETITAIHFTDPHIDNQYAVGTSMLCNLPLCCRTINGYPTETWLQAGKWGAYLCDLPEATMRNMLQYIKANFDPAFIFWTGDNVAHNGWESSEAEVI